MVEAVGNKPVVDMVTRVAAPQATTPVQAAATQTAPRQSIPADVAALSGVARTLAAQPPVDTDRVATIKKAIADGKFPILPTTIADRLIAFKLEWNGREQA